MATAYVTLVVTLPAANAADIKARIADLCNNIAGASVVLQAPEAAMLANVGHRGDNEKVEAMLCEGLYENATKASQLGLPLVTKPYSDSTTTSDFKTCDSIETLLEKPLRNTVHGNFGADIVILTPAGAGHFSLHLIQLKRGKTPLGNPKSTCSQSNRGRSVYYIHKGLADIGNELTTILVGRSARDVQRVTCRYYIMTTANVLPSSMPFLYDNGVVVIGYRDVLVSLMPVRLQDAANSWL